MTVLWGHETLTALWGARPLFMIFGCFPLFSLLMLKIVHTINHGNLAGGTFWNGNFDILIVFTLWKLRVMFKFRSDLERCYRMYRILGSQCATINICIHMCLERITRISKLSIGYILLNMCVGEIQKHLARFSQLVFTRWKKFWNSKLFKTMPDVV